MKCFSNTTAEAKLKVQRISKRLTYINFTAKRLEKEAHKARFFPFQEKRILEKFEHKLDVEQALMQLKRAYEAIYSPEYSENERVKITLSFFVNSKKTYIQTVKSAPRNAPTKKMILWKRS